MLNNNKFVFSALFLANFLLLLSLQLLFSIHVNSLPIDHTLASSFRLKVFLVLIIIVGQVIIILRLTKLKIVKNLKNYAIAKQYVGFAMFLFHTQHHPDCSCYKNHEITLKNHKICSGCYGSSVGMALGMVVLITTFILQTSFSYYYYIGILLIQVALLKFIFASYTRFILNAFFSLGVNFLLASSLMNGNAVVYALLFIPILLLELLFRLFIADLDNTVEVCPEDLRH